MSNTHNANGQYALWSGGSDSIEADTVERLRSFHNMDDSGFFTCEQCDRNVHVFNGPRGGYNEQVFSYVRYGPYFVCGLCIVSAFDLPEIPHGGDWWDVMEVRG